MPHDMSEKPGAHETVSLVALTTILKQTSQITLNKGAVVDTKALLHLLVPINHIHPGPGVLDTRALCRIDDGSGSSTYYTVETGMSCGDSMARNNALGNTLCSRGGNIENCA
jgi:hypothetical protein